MVDISSQEKKINIKIQSGGVQANVGVTQDTAQYYSEKSREWATSNRIVDNTDYSSKHYAEKSKESEEKAENYERSVIEKYNSFIDISNQAESEIIEEKTNAIEQIDTKKSESIAEINNETNSSINAINLSKENAKTEISNSKDSAISQINNTGIDARANLDLSNLSETGQTKLDQKVNKSGDTMSGDLTILRTNTASFQTRSSSYDATTVTAPTSNITVGRYLCRDKNKVYTGGIENRFTTANEVQTFLNVSRKIDNVTKSCVLTLGVKADGTPYTSAPTPATGDNSNKIATTSYCVNMRCTSKATTTSSASTTRPCWVVQNYVSGASWYRVWSDGWIEQGGKYTTSGTYTFLKPFSNINYCLTTGSFLNDGQNMTYQRDSAFDRTVTGFTVICGAQQTWYACGY